MRINFIPSQPNFVDNIGGFCESRCASVLVTFFEVCDRVGRFEASEQQQLLRQRKQ